MKINTWFLIALTFQGCGILVINIGLLTAILFSIVEVYEIGSPIVSSVDTILEEISVNEPILYKKIVSFLSLLSMDEPILFEKFVRLMRKTSTIEDKVYKKIDTLTAHIEKIAKKV